MWNLLWPMLMVVGANTVYNICAKSVPDKLNSFAALTINYLVAAGLSLALFYLTSGGGKSLVQEMAKTNWAPVVMGLTVVGLELGYIFIYRAGWKVSVASLVANIALACLLVVVGVLLYKEVLTLRQVAGMGLCVKTPPAVSGVPWGSGRRLFGLSVRGAERSTPGSGRRCA